MESARTWIRPGASIFVFVLAVALMGGAWGWVILAPSNAAWVVPAGIGMLFAGMILVGVAIRILIPAPSDVG